MAIEIANHRGRDIGRAAARWISRRSRQDHLIGADRRENSRLVLGDLEAKAGNALRMGVETH
jgi:hypothetical protein